MNRSSFIGRVLAFIPLASTLTSLPRLEQIEETSEAPEAESISHQFIGPITEEGSMYTNKASQVFNGPATYRAVDEAAKEGFDKLVVWIRRAGRIDRFEFDTSTYIQNRVSIGTL